MQSISSNMRLKQLLINRARIVKNASGKVPLAIDLCTESMKGQSWIIYCDNITQLKDVLEGAIDAGFDAFEYYADMVGDREMRHSDIFLRTVGVLFRLSAWMKVSISSYHARFL